MAKRRKVKKTVQAPADRNIPAVQAQGPFWLNPRVHRIFIFILACLLYANTIGHDYTQDDAIVIYDNMYTQKGLSGIPGLLTKDTFFGFFKEEGKAKLVSGGRYRPLTPVMFAVEWQLFGRSPMMGHIINILVYGLLGLLIYNLLSLLVLKFKKTDNLRLFLLLAAAIYVAHPLHTEVVANIKGRDEIMSMMGSILALWAVLKYHYTKRTKYLVLSMVAFFLGLLSKENAITFLAIVPLAFYFFTKESLITGIKKTWPLLVSTLVFLAIRFSILGSDFGGTPMELMNNPYLKLSGNQWVPFTFGEKYATILFTLGKYVSLLVFPHPLTHDYYPRHIDIMHFSDWQVLFSLVLYIGLTVLAIVFRNKDRWISFGILFYLITLSIVSNIVFPIGTNMSERFMFMPSLGYAIILARLIVKYLPRKAALGVGAIVVVLLSAKTILRNPVWKNDFTLFTTDINTSANSAKLLNAAGGTLTTEGGKMQDGPQKTEYLTRALGYLDKATTIHPTYKNAYLLKGNANYYLKRYNASIQSFDMALRIDPNYQDAQRNLAVALRDGARVAGQERNDFNTAEQMLLRSVSLYGQDAETYRLLGITYGIRGDHAKAIENFQKSINIKPDNASVYVSLGTAYRNMGNEEKARESFLKAQQLDPNALNFNQ